MTSTRDTRIDITLADAGTASGAASAAVAQAPAAQAREGSDRTNLFDLDRVRLEDFFEQVLGEKRYRAHQVMKWIHHRHTTDFAAMTDLGKAFRAKLEQHAVVHAPSVVLDKASEDGTHKWLLGMDPKNAIAKNRDLMGATDPKKAAPGTIRADFADSIDANAVHGSDAAETAKNEVAFFFPGMNVYSR